MDLKVFSALFITFAVASSVVNAYGYGTGSGSRETTESYEVTTRYPSQPDREYRPSDGASREASNNKYSTGPGNRYPSDDRNPSSSESRFGNEYDGQVNFFARRNHLERYGYPEGCVFSPEYKERCNYYVEISKNESGLYPDELLFELAGHVQPYEGGYVAVGLSKDKKMGQDHMVECVKRKGNAAPEIYHSWAESQTRPKRLRDEQKVLEMEEFYPKYDQDTGILTCKFRRPILTSVDLKDIGQEQIVSFDLMRDKIYILLAQAGMRAEANSDQIGYHGSNPLGSGAAYVSKNYLGFSNEKYPRSTRDPYYSQNSKQAKGKRGSGYTARPTALVILFFAVFSLL